VQLDIYQAETAAHAVKQDLILQEARQNLARAGTDAYRFMIDFLNRPIETNLQKDEEK
jgi:hypothetical protein